MLNKQNLIICDTCSNILSDGITLLPGYLAIDGGKVYKYTSIDPNNKHDNMPHDPRHDLPRNRLTGDNGEEYTVSQIVTLEGVEPARLKDGEYCNQVCATS